MESFRPLRSPSGPANRKVSHLFHSTFLSGIWRINSVSPVVFQHECNSPTGIFGLFVGFIRYCVFTNPALWPKQKTGQRWHQICPGRSAVSAQYVDADL